jgi:hypothetical protein
MEQAHRELHDQVNKMSCCEDYIDPFERECKHGRRDGMRCVECALDTLDERADEEEDWERLSRRMPYAKHGPSSLRMLHRGRR